MKERRREGEEDSGQIETSGIVRDREIERKNRGRERKRRKGTDDKQ